MLDGATMTRTDAHGKHLFVIFRAHRPADRILHIHLGLYGKFPIAAGPAQDPRGALRLRLENDSSWADLRGPTACELITPIERDVILARLGPDPSAPTPIQSAPGPGSPGPRCPSARC